MPIEVPFIPNSELESRADHFRSEFWGEQHPVNPHVIWEFRKNNFWDYVPHLRDRTNVEAYLTLDFSTIVLDRGMGLSPLAAKRLNFSIAHEMGHFCLHQGLLRDYIGPEFEKSDSPIFWKVWLQSYYPKAYSDVEYQANKFAASLLMPRQFIIKSFANWATELNKRGSMTSLKDLGNEGFRAYFASHLADEYEVSLRAMLFRLNDLQIWPVGLDMTGEDG